MLTILSNEVAVFLAEIPDADDFTKQFVDRAVKAGIIEHTEAYHEVRTLDLDQEVDATLRLSVEVRDESGYWSIAGLDDKWTVNSPEGKSAEIIASIAIEKLTPCSSPLRKIVSIEASVSELGSAQGSVEFFTLGDATPFADTDADKNVVWAAWLSTPGLKEKVAGLEKMG